MRRLIPFLVAVTACRTTPAEADEPPMPPTHEVAPAAPATPSVQPVAGQRIVAIGDLHADLTQTLAILQLAGLTDAAGHWTGGNTLFVQTGDQTDRGPDSLAIIELLVRLESEAREAGGEVIALIGNHEVMNAHGDWRYVTPGDVAAYGGVQARAEDWTADGVSGRFVRSHDAVVVVGDTAFTHGGVHPDWAARGVDAINAAVLAGVDDPDAAAVGADGPLWFRGYAQAAEPEVCEALDIALDALGARRMAVGHTVQASGTVTARCGGRLLLIDVGVASHYGGHLAALEIVDGDARTLTPSGTTDLPDPE